MNRNGPLNRVCTSAAGVVKRTIAGETLLVPTIGELANLQRLFVLDEVGEFVWQQFDGERDLSTIVQGVASEFEVSVDRAADDLSEFVDALLDAGLVTVADHAGSGEAHDSVVTADDR